MRQVALFIGIPAAITAGALIFAGTRDGRSECEIEHDATMVCAINLGRGRLVTERDMMYCRNMTGISSLETQE